MRNESRSETRIHSSTTSGSIVTGQVSLPMPSTRYGCTGCESSAVKTDPSGSAPTISTSGLRSLKYFPIPEIEPPVPTETTIASTSPPVCSQSSGPVVS